MTSDFNPIRDRWLRMIPAYGRDYTNPDQILADWKAGKDFLIEDNWSIYWGRYINIDDANSPNLRGITFEVRYNSREKTCWLRCQDNVWVVIEKETK